MSARRMAVAVLVMLLTVSVCSALSDLEERMLHQEASKLAKNTGMSEDDLYKNLVLRYAAKQSLRTAQNAAVDSVERQHANLRVTVYEKMADASLQVAFTLKAAKELIVDLEKEQATGTKVVSPALSRRINSIGNAATDAFSMVAKMNNAMIELASFEAIQGCSTKNGYATITCSEGLKRSVVEIHAAMDILTKVVVPFADAALLGAMKYFTY